MNVRLLAAAQVEFLEALAYYEGQRDGLGRSFAADFDGMVSKIRQSPSSYPPHFHGTRRGRLDRFPYGIVFRQRSRRFRSWL